MTKNTDIFVEKWEKLQKLLAFFHKKYWHIWDINVWNFNVSLTNDVVSFELPGPVLFAKTHVLLMDNPLMAQTLAIFKKWWVLNINTKVNVKMMNR